MTTVSVAEFAMRAPELLASVEAGNTVVVQRDGKPIAHLQSSADRTRSSSGPSEETEESVSNDIFAGAVVRSLLTEFTLGTSTMTLEPRQPDLNLAWFRNENDDDS